MAAQIPYAHVKKYVSLSKWIKVIIVLRKEILTPVRSYLPITKSMRVMEVRRQDFNIECSTGCLGE